MVIGVVEPPQDLEIKSRMSTNDVIFSDGIENDYLEFNAGSIVKISPSPQTAYLIKNTLKGWILKQ